MEGARPGRKPGDRGGGWGVRRRPGDWGGGHRTREEARMLGRRLGCKEEARRLGRRPGCQREGWCRNVGRRGQRPDQGTAASMEVNEWI